MEIKHTVIAIVAAAVLSACSSFTYRNHNQEIIPISLIK